MRTRKELLARIEMSLDTMRPYLEKDGGNVEVVELTEDNILKVRLLGNCRTCAISDMTMKAGIEEAVIGSLPEIKAVEEVK